MQDAARTDNPGNRRAGQDTGSSDAASWAALLESVLRREQKTTTEEEVDVRTRLLRLYLDELGDPLSAAVHAEALLDRNTTDRAVVDAAAALLEYRPIAARIAGRLSAAYARLGDVPGEIDMLSRELSLARPPRLDEVKRRLAELRLVHLHDVDGALELLEPQVLRSPADHALRARYLEIATTSGRRARAVKTLLQIHKKEKKGALRASVLTELGLLYRQDGDLGRARDAFSRALEGAEGGPVALEAAKHLLRLDPQPTDPGVAAAFDIVTRFDPALELATDPADRRRILKVLAAICRERLDDPSRALELSQRVLRDDPRDLEALMGSLWAYERLGNTEALYAEIEHALFLFEGEQCAAVLLRKASALAKFGEREQSSDVLAKLLDQPDLPPPLVESILATSYEEEQFDVYRKALERLVQSGDRTVRMRVLERLGDFHFEQRGDGPAAIELWKVAARLCMNESPGDVHGRELYERVLDVSPNDGESARELVGLYAKSGDWARVPEVYGALLRSGSGIDVALATLFDVEAAAARASAVEEYVAMVDETLPHLSSRDDDLHRRLLRSKARTLSADPRRESEASAAHRQVLESFGSDGDVETYAGFIESRSSPGERRADLRWLFEFRVNRAVDPLALLNEWAGVEEANDDLEGALRVHRRILERAPGNPRALEAIARLEHASGNLEECLAALRALRDEAEPSAAAALDLRMASLLVDELGRPIDGARLLEPWLTGARPSSEALAIIGRALAAVGDRAMPESSRLGWHERLVELHASDPESALELAVRGVQDLPDAQPLWEAVARLSRQLGRASMAAKAYRATAGDGMAKEIAEVAGELVIGLLDETAADTEEILETLEVILRRVPTAHWALNRATLILSARERWEQLFRHYERAIESAPDDRVRVELLNQAAVAARDLANEPERAIGFFEAILHIRPSEVAVQAALERLYERGGKTHELVRLLSMRVEQVTGVARPELLHRLASAQLDLGHVDSAAEALERMLESGVAVSDVKELLERMLLRACAGETSAATRSLAAAERAASLLSAHYAACGLTRDLMRVTRAISAHYDSHGRSELALAVLEDGLKLPFAIAERRELRALIASVLADRLNQPERAARAFEELFLEDAGDRVAESCAERFAALLASAGRRREQAELWERIGHCRGSSDDGVRAADAWSRAASLREELADSMGAVGAHSAAAALGSGAAIASLARLHAAAGRWLEAAHALEWLVPGLSGERRLECWLTMADAYAKAGEMEIARRRLAELIAAEPEARQPRARLLELYRDGEVWSPLAELLVDTARLTTEPEQRLDLLREAIGIRLRRLRDPDGAASLAAIALGADPQSTALRLELGEALDAAGRHDESVKVLREGLSLGGEGRSKQNAKLHRAIAGVLLHAGRRQEALGALESAARLNPTDPGTLHALGRVALDEGNVDLADATLRGLVLLLRHGAAVGSDCPSRADVYLDLSRIAELRGDAIRARDLAESAFDAALEKPDETARLERALEQSRHHDLLALVLERRLRSGADPETTAQALDALVTLWEGPLDRSAETAPVIARHAELVARAAESTGSVVQSVWAAYVRACAAIGGEAARGDAVRRHIGQLARAAEGLDGGEATAVLLESARQYANALGQYERAASIAEALFEKDPTRADVWLLLRDLYAHLGTPDRLVDLADAVLWSTSSSALQKQLRLDLAKMLLENPDKVDLAIATLKGILEDEPSDVSTRDMLADALEREGRYEELVEVIPTDYLEQLLRRRGGASAIEVARRLVHLRTAKEDRIGLARALSLGFALAPGDPDFRDRLLQILEDEGRWDDALEVLDRALLEYPADADLLRKRAWLHEAAGRLDDAIGDLEKACSVDAGFAEDLVSLLAVAASGDDGRRSLELVDLLLTLDRPSDARSVVEALLARMPGHVGGLERLASLTAADGDTILAAQLYRELLPMLRGDPSAVVRVSLALAAVCEDQGKLVDAADALERAHAVDPTNAELLRLLIRAAGCVLDTAPLRALHLAEASLAADPRRTDGIAVRARALARLGRLDEAEATLRELSKMRKGKAAELVSSVHLELARLYLSRDDLVEALDCLKSAFAVDPKNDEASLLLGLVAIDLDDLVALRALRAATAPRSSLAPESKAIALHQLSRLARSAGGAASVPERAGSRR